MMNPVDLLRFNRFDVPAKTLYLRHLAKGVQEVRGEPVYLDLVGTWNGFREYDDQSKAGKDVFLDRFQGLDSSIKSDGYNKEYPVPVNKEGMLLNGSHRLASCLVNGVEIEPVETSDPSAGQLDCTSYYFLNRGLNYKTADSIAIEYARLKPTTRMAFIFPKATAQGNLVEARTKIAESRLRLVYEKGAVLSGFGPLNLMRQLYRDENWVGDISTRFHGFNAKAQMCYAGKEANPTYAFLLDDESGGESEAADLKKKIRDLFGIQNHSIHITDTHEEACRLSQIFFSNNSLHYLIKSNPYSDMPRFRHLTAELKGWIHRNKYDAEDLCITSSSVMSAYGLRDGRDIDILSRTEISKIHPLIGDHESELGMYGHTKQQILYDDNLHFWYDGLKYASLEVVRGLKRNRGEPKDHRDLELMKGI